MSSLKGIFCNILLLALLAAGQAVFAQDDSLVVNFKDALKIVIENNSDVQEAKYNWLVRSEYVQGTYGAFEPHLTGRTFKERGERPGALFTETRDEYKIGVQGKLPTGTEYDVGFNQATYTHSDYTSELYFGAELRQHLLKDGPLYFAPTNEFRAAKLQKEYAYQKYREALSGILEKFCDTYWSYYISQQMFLFSTESARVAADIVSDAQKRLRHGLLSKLDYQKTIAEFSNREASRLEAIDKLRNARLEFLLMLSSTDLLQDERPLSIAPETELLVERDLDSLSFIDSISVMHPTYLMQNAEVNIRETELDLHKAGFLPKLDIVGNYGIRNRNNNAYAAVAGFKNKNVRQTVLAGGIEIDVPLFANVYERHQIAAEKANVRSAKIRLALVQNKLFEEYKLLKKRAIELRDQYLLSEVTVSYHEKELQEEFKKLELGKSNYHQIFEMEEDLREAKQRHLECLRLLRVIDARLSRATGKILLQNDLEFWKEGKLTLREELTHE